MRAGWVQWVAPAGIAAVLMAGATVFLTFWTAAGTLGPQAASVSVTLGPAGITQLAYQSDVLFNQQADPGGAFHVVDFTEESGGKRTYHPVNRGMYRTAWDNADQTLTLSFAWGTVAAQYSATSAGVEMTITVHNATAADTIDGLNIFPLALTFPRGPEFGGGSNTAMGVGEPGVTVADFGSGSVAMVNEQIGRPFYSGFLSDDHTAKTHRYETWIGSAPLPHRANSWPRFYEPIGPGASDTYDVSLRFGPAGSTAGELAPDVLAAYAAHYPFELNWPDRRPIGALFPSGSGKAGHSATNPRGWFNDPKVNVTTPRGLDQFAHRLLAYAASSIAILKQMNAQGMITWDIEGQSNPNIDYVGDPPMATKLAPELTHDDLADRYFALFRKAGLRVGVTIRYQQLIDDNGVYRQKELTDPDAEVRMLVAKISYARQHWGCSLFYIDSTGWYDDPAILRRVHELCPDVLLIPEHAGVGDYSVAASYQDLALRGTSLPALALEVYPHAFNVINVSHGNPAAQISALVQSVRQGDILIFPGWVHSPLDPIIAEIYRRAAQSPATKP